MKIPKNSFIPFVTAGHPDLETSRGIVLALAEAGSAAIEIGIPFSDPIADGPVIQRSSFEALKHGYGMSDYIQMVKEIREKSDVGLVFMTYLNPVLQFGLERLDEEGSNAGLDAILISDLTPEEYVFGYRVPSTESRDKVHASRESEYRAPSTEIRKNASSPEPDKPEEPPTTNHQPPIPRPASRESENREPRTEHRDSDIPVPGTRYPVRLLPSFKNLDTVFLVAPTSSDERVKRVCEATTGYVYLIARTGVTGKQTQIDESIGVSVERIRSCTGLPIAVGFGIRSKKDVQKVWQHAEGAIVGSAIVKFIEENRDKDDLPKRVAEYVKDEFLP